MKNETNSAEPFLPEEMVNASELREFLFCERAWFLSGRGFDVTPAAQSQRTAGIAFHEARAAAAGQGRSSMPYLWALLLAGAAIILIIVSFWAGGR